LEHSTAEKVEKNNTGKKKNGTRIKKPGIRKQRRLKSHRCKGPKVRREELENCPNCVYSRKVPPLVPPSGGREDGWGEERADMKKKITGKDKKKPDT